VTEANLSPSVHNTQPTRWSLDGGGLVLSIDETRLLGVGDPSGHDAQLSMGAALLGTRIAASRFGLGVRGIDYGKSDARIEFCKKSEKFTEKIWDIHVVKRRMTWRNGFSNLPKTDLSKLAFRVDTQLTNEQKLIDAIAELNDTSSLFIMRSSAFRHELRSWMRLSTNHRDWARDGLNADALGFSKFEALAARVVLRKPVFEALDGLGLGTVITGEAEKTRTAHWIAAFHRPREESPLISGEAFYELWLELTLLGQAAWPMTALADVPDANAEVCRLMNVPNDHRLINVLRIGPLPKRALTKARLLSNELIIE